MTDHATRSDFIDAIADKLCPAEHRAPAEGLPHSCHNCYLTAEESFGAIIEMGWTLMGPTGELPIQPDDAMARRFVLNRVEDPTGISGIGTVAWGVWWPDETCSLRWNTAFRSSVTYEQGLDAVRAIHGHEGKTEIVWLDRDPELPPRGDREVLGSVIQTWKILENSLVEWGTPRDLAENTAKAMVARLAGNDPPILPVYDHQVKDA